MKILLVDAAFEYGGQEKYVVDLAEALQTQGHLVSVICNPCEAFELELRSREVPYEPVLNLDRQVSLSSIRALSRHLRTYCPDVLHLHGSRAGLLGVLAAGFTGFKSVVWHFHINTINLVAGKGIKAKLQRFAYRSVESFLVGRCAAAVGVSDAITDAINIRGRHRPPIHRTIRNGIRPLTSSRVPAEVRRDFGVSEGDCLVGMVARLNRQKAVHVFIEAMHKVRTKSPRVKALIVGDGDLRAGLEAQVRELGLDQVVTFAGFRRDIPDIIGAFDVFVLSSLYEGLPLSLLEAMSLERPAVVTAVDGNKEVVVDGETGLLVPPGDSDALAEGISRLASDAQVRKVLGESGHRRFHSEFSFDRMIEEIVDLYATVVQM